MAILKNMDRNERLGRSIHARQRRARLKKTLSQRSDNLYAHLVRLRHKKRKFHDKHPLISY